MMGASEWNRVGRGNRKMGIITFGLTFVLLAVLGPVPGRAQSGGTAGPGVGGGKPSIVLRMPDRPSGLRAASGIPPAGPRPWQAGLASLALPGAGQLWQGRKWGLGLLAGDLGLAAATVWTNAEGRDRQERYERFADAHWDRQRWLDYLACYESLTGEPWPHQHHTIPPEGTYDHDYYEMIGKYDQFAPGWDDWTALVSDPVQGTSEHRNDYLVQRQRANRWLAWSVTAGGLVFLNHVAAAAEAWLWGRTHDGPPRLRVGLRRGPGDASLWVLHLRLGSVR
jgi:hypothetical protein